VLESLSRCYNSRALPQRKQSLDNFKTLFLASAAAFLLVSNAACAQVYSWKDPNTGQSHFSNIAPPWYRRTEAVSGPRVIETLDGKVVDDTALPDEDRLLLSGKSKDYVEKLQAQKDHESAARHDLIRESTKTDTRVANRPSADTTPTSEEPK